MDSASGGMEGASPSVAVAPLIVAAVCRDGVAVVAARQRKTNPLYHSITVCKIAIALSDVEG
jgi:hypothetical protein